MKATLLTRIATLLSMATVYTYGIEFLYPVCTYTDSACTYQKLLVLHQKNATQTMLWSWDPITHRAEQLLPGSFTPAGVCLLASGAGFSFIDNGRIRIKEFIKRSARSVESEALISNSGPISWYANDVGYFHALDRHYYALFSISRTGDIARCVALPARDCMYPALSNGSLFYIQRAEQKQATGHESHYTIVEQVVAQPHTQVVCVDFQNRPIIFLQMADANQGFFVEHPSHIDPDAPIITCAYHQLLRSDKTEWETHQLFSFSIPTCLIHGSRDQRLYESILPLLPRRADGIIYYVDYTAMGHGTICSYNCTTRKQELYPNSCTEYPLAPLSNGHSVMYGGSISYYERTITTADHAPCAYLDADGNLCFSFPCMPVAHQ